ncbi:cobalt ECF transporter T component CbiQ [Methanolobus bombayensis]|uniref:cobalt ECF transporter T component CbiQ n=1 Tax=Methanolobus bombayensis TaxID=38023 RepID=UPI001AEB6017|nr:cobalt ECF transporter T component CbiQ [Methanolobus bombayensis]MBP1907889.1 cobalt/nickel transport system permease protein [Methanolobus bombayensis]
MAHILDDYAVLSPLRYKNNWLKIAIVTFGLLAGVSSNSPLVPFLIAICMSFATLYFAKVPASFYFRILAAPAGFVIVSVVIIAFFFGEGAKLFSFDVFGLTLGVSKAGLDMALLVFARTLGGMSCLFFLSLTTPMIELFSVLKATKLPDSFLEIAMMMYRYIFVFLDVAVGVKYAQSVRLGYKDFKTSFRSMVMLGTNLFIRSWEQGEKIYVSMNARCYDGKLILLDDKRPVEMPELMLTLAYFALVVLTFYFTRTVSVL